MDHLQHAAAATAAGMRAFPGLIGMVLAHPARVFAERAHLSLNALVRSTGLVQKIGDCGEDCEILAGKNRIAGIE
jgi:hypothetical protein